LYDCTVICSNCECIMLLKTTKSQIQKGIFMENLEVSSPAGFSVISSRFSRLVLAFGTFFILLPPFFLSHRDFIFSNVHFTNVFFSEDSRLGDWFTRNLVMTNSKTDVNLGLGMPKIIKVNCSVCPKKYYTVFSIRP